jgi:outer membrane protein TolC
MKPPTTIAITAKTKVPKNQSKMKQFFVLFILTIINHTAHAQLPIMVDSTGVKMIFSQKNFLNAIKKNHPVAQQNQLLTAQAEANMLMAKGGFDPYIYGDLNKKTFDEKNYFTVIETAVKIPLYIGELKGGYNTASGTQLNSENKLPANGQMYMGISLPLLQGVAIDGRRAAVQQAKIFAQNNQLQQRIIINNLLYDAATAYWNWALAYNLLNLNKTALKMGQSRYVWIKQSHEQGDIAAIDTLEALLQLQQRQIFINDAQNEYDNATLLLSVFLWNDAQQPVTLLPNAVPQTISSIAINNEMGRVADSLYLFMQQAATHPEVLQYEYKIKNLEVERKLKADKIKPKLNVNYNLLGNGTRIGSQNPDLRLWQDNYKYGASLSMPLPLRTERGSLRITKIKIADAQYERQLKQATVQAKIQTAYNNIKNTSAQIQLLAQMTTSYEVLLRAEEEEFRNGESSLFLINSRETKLIEAQAKLIETQAKYQKHVAALAFARAAID